jgi:hypothetical protein
MSRINSLCHDLRLQAHSKFEKQYVEQLEESFSALRETFPRPSTVCLTRSIVDSLQVYLEDCKNYLQELDSVLRDATVGRVQRTHRSIAGYIQNCPRVCTIFWLRRLNQELWTKLSDEWRAIIIDMALPSQSCSVPIDCSACQIVPMNLLMNSLTSAIRTGTPRCTQNHYSSRPKVAS